MMSRIEQLALDLLDQNELQLADHLLLLLSDDKWDAGPVFENMLPVYWQKVGDILETLEPDNIYRALYYIHTWSSLGDFKDRTRAYMDVISAHIEGCLQNLLKLPAHGRTMEKAFGPATISLYKKNILSEKLTRELLRFNEVINVPAKHFGAYAPTRRLDERTFGSIETVYAIVLMRKLSIQLFELLKADGVTLPQSWPSFKEEWLSWFPEYHDTN
jgi:hypothetical protein